MVSRWSCVYPSVSPISVSLLVFSIPDDNSEYQWIFTKLGMCIDIVEISFLMGKFCQFLTELSAHNMSDFLFQDGNLSKYQLTAFPLTF